MLGGYLGNMNNFMLAFIITGVMNLVAAVIISTAKIPTNVVVDDSTPDASIVTSTLNPVMLKEVKNGAV